MTIQERLCKSPRARSTALGTCLALLTGLLGCPPTPITSKKAAGGDAAPVGSATASTNVFQLDQTGFEGIDPSASMWSKCKWTVKAWFLDVSRDDATAGGHADSSGTFTSYGGKQTGPTMTGTISADPGGLTVHVEWDRSSVPADAKALHVRAYCDGKPVGPGKVYDLPK